MLPAVIPPPAMDPGPGAKPVVRSATLALRDAMPAEARATASRAIADVVDTQVLAGLIPGSIVALYFPKATEVDTAGIAERARDRDLVIAYPRVVRPHRVLVFHRASAGDLVTGTFGLREPRPDAPIVEISELSAIIVPGIAFDATGHRLGWGRGYYDATLSAARSITSIGIAFTCQIIPVVPAAENDVPVHLVITDTGLVRAP